MNRLLCDYCHDGILPPVIRLTERGRGDRKFNFDMGCALLLESRGSLEIKGQRYAYPLLPEEENYG